MRRQVLIVVAAVLALRAPFLNQAIQGDDVYYLYGAERAQIDPLHPHHARYAFLGQTVDMRGHPHPPLNAWVLAGLLALFQDVREIPFHAAYVSFSLIAALSALSLARRFSARPLAATLLFLATPALVVNGNSLEADVPFLAFWLLSVALFVRAVDGRSRALLLFSAGAMALAALSAYQAIVLAPILILYGRKWRISWMAALTAPAVLAAWQIFERASTGALPATVLAGYMHAYALQAVAQKFRNAAALTGHMAWLVFPALWIPALWIPALWIRGRWAPGRWAPGRWIPGALAALFAVGAALIDPNPLFWASIAVGAAILIECARNWREFTAQWTLIFFAAALALFFAGSARYLLPIALPVALLATRQVASRRGATRQVASRWLYAAFAGELVLSLGFAIVNYQHWDGYREFARALKSDAETRRVWVNGEWGLRYYFEAEGALPLMQAQAAHPGEMVVSSSLAYPLPFTVGGGALATVAEREITSAIPLRLTALNGKSAYSTTRFGLRPFDISTGPIDRVRAQMALARKPAAAELAMNSAEAERQIVSGIYALENGQWRWMAGSAAALLKPPGGPAKLEVKLFIPEQAPARRVTLAVDGQRVADETFPGPGSYTLRSPALALSGDSASVAITVDRTFSAPGDRRELGVILTEISLRR